MEIEAPIDGLLRVLVGMIMFLYRSPTSPAELDFLSCVNTFNKRTNK